MSLFTSATATCPQCDTQTAVQYAASVNADRRPDLRLAIRQGTFQAETCPKCGTRMRLPAQLTYLDLRRGQWILVHNAEALAQWPAEEAQAVEIFEQAFGTQAPPPAQEIGRELTPRLVFGWPALREKLVCAELALDDATLELLKIAVMRNVPGQPAADADELRLTGGDASVLNLAWISAATEAPVATLPVPKQAYDDIAEDLESWTVLRKQVQGQLFVDMGRLLAG